MPGGFNGAACHTYLYRFHVRNDERKSKRRRRKKPTREPKGGPRLRTRANRERGRSEKGAKDREQSTTGVALHDRAVRKAYTRHCISGRTAVCCVCGGLTKRRASRPPLSRTPTSTAQLLSQLLYSLLAILCTVYSRAPLNSCLCYFEGKRRAGDTARGVHVRHARRGCVRIEQGPAGREVAFILALALSANCS